MLGGNPEKGKRIFKDFIKKNPHQWLARVAYLEHYVIPMENEDAYLAQKKDLINLSRLHRKKLKDALGKVNDPAFENQRLRLYQATAIKRFEIIRKFETTYSLDRCFCYRKSMASTFWAFFIYARYLRCW